GRIIIGAYSFCIYLLKFIWPYQMLPLYAYPEKLFGYMYIALIPMLLYLYMLYHAYRKGYRNLFFGMFFFLVNVMFVLQILGAGQGYLADRFTYIPYLGFFYILLWVAGKYSSSLTYAGFAIYLVLLGKFCIAQQEIWKNGEQLWTHVIEAGQNAPLPYNNRAIYYREHKQADKALADFQKALSLKPEAGTYNSCGKMFFDQGKIAQAIEYYNQAIRMKPNDDEYLVNRAVAFAASGKNTESLADFSAGLKINPQNLNAYLNRSLLFFITGRYEDAIADHTAYLALDSTKTELYYERGNCKAILKRYAEAIADFDTAIRSEPSKGLYYLERAKSYYYLNEKSNARADVQKAIQLGVSIPEDLKQTLLAP
ncbi:MAG TPA: tetratricopeptide repeat protein, partial [Chitinophagaceae bacterium]|nr:tetratricopeptide repeat protein [Chitinophagaceae bacterium]